MVLVDKHKSLLQHVTASPVTYSSFSSNINRFDSTCVHAPVPSTKNLDSLGPGTYKSRPGLSREVLQCPINYSIIKSSVPRLKDTSKPAVPDNVGPGAYDVANRKPFYTPNEKGTSVFLSKTNRFRTDGSKLDQDLVSKAETHYTFKSDERFWKRGFQAPKDKRFRKEIPRTKPEVGVGSYNIDNASIQRNVMATRRSYSAIFKSSQDRFSTIPCMPRSATAQLTDLGPGSYYPSYEYHDTDENDAPRRRPDSRAAPTRRAASAPAQMQDGREAEDLKRSIQRGDLNGIRRAAGISQVDKSRGGRPDSADMTERAQTAPGGARSRPTTPAVLSINNRGMDGEVRVSEPYRPSSSFSSKSKRSTDAPPSLASRARTDASYLLKADSKRWVSGGFAWSISDRFSDGIGLSS
eukprot:Rmarinus@m.22814